MRKKGSTDVTVAVHPFVNLSDSDDLDYFVVGFTEDLITDLSRFGALEILSMQNRQAKSPDGKEKGIESDYKVKGSFRHQNGKVRINVQLTSSNPERVIWAERYDEEMTSVFDIQDDITERIVSSVQKEIDHEILSTIKQRNITSLAAYDCWLRGMEFLKKGSLEDDERAREYFQQALKIDPHYSRAYTGLSLTYFNEWSCQIWERWEVSQKGARKYAQKAIEMDENDYLALSVLGRTHLYEGEYEKSEYCLRRSLRLNPSDPDNLVQLASCFTFHGYVDEAKKLLEKAFRLNPVPPVWYNSYGTFVYYESGDFDKCIAMGNAASDQALWVDLPAFMAAAYHAIDDHENMNKQWANYLKQFSQKILFGKKARPGEALQWFINVNPYRGKARLHDFLDFMQAGQPIAEAAGPPSTTFKVARFKRENDVWTLHYEGIQITVPQRKGYEDIAKLLAAPGKEIHCTDLMNVGVHESGLEVIDEKARKEYQSRLRSIESEIAKAEKRSDPIKLEKLHREYDQLIDHLSSVVGLKGSTRKVNSSVERSRSAVTWRIRDAIKKLEKAHPPLFNHLCLAIKTGTFCAYLPEKPIDWEVD